MASVAEILPENPDAPRQDLSYMCTFTPFYDDLRQVFTGLQVAGPRVEPKGATPDRDALS